MNNSILSVGLDVGTTSTQMILSRLTLQNRASGFTVPELVISGREILYESPVHLTPLLDESRIDGEGLRALVDREYAAAGITPEQVDTGAVIVTGETSRKENADAVLRVLSAHAGDFVVATAGPDLESRMAARGSGAVADSEKTGKTLLHMDIGGGTSNLSLIAAGEIVDTGCINVGGRLVTWGKDRVITWVSPALGALFSKKPGEEIREEEAWTLAQTLARVLEMAAGLRKPDETLENLITLEGKCLDPALLPEQPVLSFSGGVADCMAHPVHWQTYGDLGPLLARAIRESRLFAGPVRIGEKPIRATVIGAGCHAAQLSGSTVYHQNVDFPLKDLPVLTLGKGQRVTGDGIRRLLSRQDGPGVLWLEGPENPDYAQVSHLAVEILAGFSGRPIYLALGRDMARALGQTLALGAGPDREILCIDRVALGEGSYLDVGAPLGPAIPVVVKTLIFGRQKDGRKQ